jgi:hypothetical protein
VSGKLEKKIQIKWETLIEPVRRVVENRFCRITLKEEPFQVLNPLPENEIDYLTRHLSYLFPNLDKNNLVNSKTNKMQEYIDWVEKHCRQWQYSFQIRKCVDPECCSPLTKPREWLPDPMLQDNGEHYKDLKDVFGIDTSETDKPTLLKPSDNVGEISTKRKKPVQ